VRHAESRHAGEIRFVVETALDVPELSRGISPRHRAVQLFGQLGIWDTTHNNGVLIYVLMADHVVEIVADRGIAERIAQSEWDEVCRQMEQHYREQRFSDGSVAGVQGISRLLARHFPSGGPSADELPNQPLLL
jgi:uncharacterized membrane protein